MTDAPQKDLDTFLTSVESKLRGPFTSFEVSKAVSTKALRGSLSPKEYLDRISQVLQRPEKKIQMRILIGLLGLNSDPSSAQKILVILAQAQQAREYTDWVRVIAGLVQGIMFENNNNNNNNNNASDKSSRNRGQEAESQLEKACDAIIDSVRTLERETADIHSNSNNDDCPSRLTTADVDPTFAPYRYALLNPNVLKATLPETQSHAHFQIDETAGILSMDAKAEATKAQEEQEHIIPSTATASLPTATAVAGSTTAIQATVVEFPGSRARPTTAATKKSSSMFMPSRKPTRPTSRVATAANNKTALKPVTKTSLHTRKAGAAQSLLAKGRRNRLKTGIMAGSATATSAVTAGSVRGRAAAQKMGNNRSKMKMIDVTEVQGLAKEQKEREETKPGKKGESKKRKSEAAATEKVSRLKLENGGTAAAAAVTKAPEAQKPKLKEAPVAATTTAAAADSAGALASAALSKYQAQRASAQATAAAAAPTAAAAAPAPAPAPAPAAAAPKQQDWRHLLQEKSNRLSAEDRFRVQQFFVDRYNPTPAQPTYKMKLHEERTNDTKTGEPVKETYYLELDYSTFTSKQSKKVKRYAN